MKKNLSALLLTAALACALMVPAGAVNVPSATVDTAPAVSGAVSSDGTAIPSGDISVTAVQDMNALPAEEAAMFQEAYQEITSSGSVAEFLDNAGLSGAVNEALAGTTVSAQDLSVQSMFDVGASGTAAEILAANGSVDITFNVPGVQANSVVVVVHYNGSSWDVRPSTCANGTVTATFTSLSPVAILVDQPAAAAGYVMSPQTSDMNLDGVLACGVLLCAGALVYSLKRSRTM